MKIEEFETLKERFDTASIILSEKYELSLRIRHMKMIIKGERSVYVPEKDKRRYPTAEEIERATADLALYTQRIEVLESQFSAL